MNNNNNNNNNNRAEEGSGGGGLFPDGFAHMFELALFMLDLKWHHDIIEAVHELEDQAALLDSKLDTTRQVLLIRQIATPVRRQHQQQHESHFNNLLSWVA